ncbi:DUF4276 family protein [Acidovorax sp. HDW3]|uniref:DUF4276 family protein n=1 Tax=Acidovorax sp. HDW3 TaxID=2714923 RepID=UPI00140C8D60|nr:DUF4276 family protein [Acidovorax sp. HDW3]QIL44953.1 DUF4276 family protein [Acidovorax sp. HDW3]
MTAYIEVLTEGASDVPVLHEILTRHWGLHKDVHFRIHPHQGRGRLPAQCLSAPDPRHRGLLDQLPAKLRGMAWLPPTALVLVLIDADDDAPQDLLQALERMLAQLPRRPPRVLFRLAVEETESWFLADAAAVKASFPQVKLRLLADIAPDAIVGAWERLAQALGEDVRGVTGARKLAWAQAIAPHMDFSVVPSPSLQALLRGLQDYLGSVTP